MPARPEYGIQTNSATMNAPSTVLDSLFRNMPGEVYRCRNDPDWTMEFVSDGVLELTGYPPSVFLSGEKRFGDLVHPDDRDWLWKAAQAATEAREPFTFEYRIRTAGGDEKWVWERGSGVYGEDGNLIALEGFVGDATARKLAERALAESEARFRDFAHATGDWFWETDAEDRYTWFSESTERVSGFLIRDLIGKCRADFIPADTDLSAEPWKSLLESIARRERFRDFRYRTSIVDRELWLSVSGLPRFDEHGHFLGYRGATRDVTAEIAAQRQLAELNERMRAAIENLDESIAITDTDDRIILGNKRFRTINGNYDSVHPGYRYEDHFYDGFAAGNYPEARGRQEEWLAERMKRRAAGGTIEVQRQDGIWLRVTDQHLPDGGIITFALDITERKAAEAALRDLNTELERRVTERTGELEATNRELEAFSYSVSHDLRAPLRAVAGFANILRQDEGDHLSPEGHRSLSKIEESACRMGELIDALLALGRLSRHRLQHSPVDIALVVREVAEDLAPTYLKSRIEIEKLPPAYGDATLLKQVFVNLVANALKYSQKADVPTVRIGTENGEYVVRDNGVGFDMAYTGKLFKPFERLHTDSEYEGTGVGLAIVKLIVERHGGAIRAETVPGEGAAFRFTLGPPG